jgi:ubiquinone/menaquinone biosynthesis C-methylase UbiE
MDYLKEYKICFDDINYASDFLMQSYLCLDYIQSIDYKEFTLVDVSSGRGKLIEKILEIPDKKISVTTTDVKKFHDLDVPFIKIDLSKDLKILKNYKFDVIVCNDVLEHLDESYIEDVIRTFSEVSNKGFFSIANHPDSHHGVVLHTIQKDLAWWKELIEKYYLITNYKSHLEGRMLTFIVDNCSKYSK